ncbi:MAG: response regulator transcription factor [Ignavibacteria bacterium]|nr:response regulator transcription factor [Ignavibacteria bacterium]
MKNPVKILVADDHPLLLKGLKQIIGQEQDMIVEDEAKNGEETISKLEAKEFDILILDIAMPVVSGIEVLEYMRRKNINIPVLVLSTYGEEQYAVRAMKLGARGYLVKDSAPENLINAIKIVYSGKKYVSEKTEKLLRKDKVKKSKPHEKLSSREYSVLMQISKGNRIKEIAARMKLSEKTVSTFKKRILKKLSVHTDAEITRYVIENKLE